MNLRKIVFDFGSHSVGKNNQTARSRLIPKITCETVSATAKDHFVSVGGRRFDFFVRFEHRRIDKKGNAKIIYKQKQR